MASAALDLSRPADLPEAERETALEASRAVSRLMGRGAVHVEAVPIAPGEASQTFILPAPAVKLLTDILVHLGAGDAVAVIPDHAEVTTQQAADFLNVSRPWIVKLIEQDELPHRMVGTHRRILFSDLRKYKDRKNQDRRRALDALAAEAQELGEYRIVTHGICRPVRCVRAVSGHGQGLVDQSCSDRPVSGALERPYQRRVDKGPHSQAP